VKVLYFIVKIKQMFEAQLEYYKLEDAWLHGHTISLHCV